MVRGGSPERAGRPRSQGRWSETAPASGRTADKLAEVCLLSGEAAWVLVHVEVQAQRDDSLARRMFRYHLRIFDHFDREPVSLAILADPGHAWRPDSFGYSRWGSTMRLEFPVVKLTDWGDRAEELASGENLPGSWHGYATPRTKDPAVADLPPSNEV